jgi:hypothetical protein
MPFFFNNIIMHTGACELGPPHAGARAPASLFYLGCTCTLGLVLLHAGLVFSHAGARALGLSHAGARVIATVPHWIREKRAKRFARSASRAKVAATGSDAMMLRSGTAAVVTSRQ